jgi:glycosyltransferase involved in cell wall biosynthesis
MAIKRILIPIIGFGKGGGNRVLSELASRWNQSGCQADFLVHEALSQPYFPTTGGVLRIASDGSVNRDGNGSAACAGSGSPRAFEIYRRLFAALRRIGAGYDVILANHSLTTYPLFFASCGTAKKVYYIQAYEPEYFATGRGVKAVLLEWLSRQSYRLPLLQIANAPVYSNYREIKTRSWVPPGIDRSTFFRRTDIPRFRAGKVCTIGTIGRTEPSKGTALVERAFEALAASDPDVRLKMAFGSSDSNWRHERAEIVKPNGDAELADFYRSVDVLIAVPTQQFGGYHYPVLEAMSCGTPVVSSGHMPATAESAWLIEPNSVAAIIDAIRLIRHAGEQQIAEKIALAEKTAAEYEWSAVARRFLDLMEAGA